MKVFLIIFTGSILSFCIVGIVRSVNHYNRELKEDQENLDKMIGVSDSNYIKMQEIDSILDEIEKNQNLIDVNYIRFDSVLSTIH